MLFDKLLNILHLEPEPEDIINHPEHISIVRPKKTSISDSFSYSTKRNKAQTTIPATESENTQDLLHSIKKYWDVNCCNNQFANYDYRSATMDELRDYAKADILSCFVKPRNNDSFSDFRLSQIGVTNWYVFFDELFTDGYIRHTDSKETLSSYTVKDLKIVADSIGIKKTGKKAELIQRVCESISITELEEILENNYLFIISEKGKHYLSTQDDLVMLRSHITSGVSLPEFIDNRFVKGIKRNFYNTMFRALCDQKNFYYSNKNFSMMSIVCLHIYDIMFEEWKQTSHNVPIDILLENYMTYLYLCTCLINETTSLSQGLISYTCIEHILMPRINASLANFLEFKEFINYRAVFVNKPPSFLKKEEFISFIEEFFNTSMLDYSKWDKLLQDHFTKYLKLF